MPFTTHSNPLPLLCRNLHPLSQQLRQESGHFLGISPKSQYLSIRIKIHTLIVFFLHICFRLLVIWFEKEKGSQRRALFCDPILEYFVSLSYNTCVFHVICASSTCTELPSAETLNFASRACKIIISYNSAIGDTYSSAAFSIPSSSSNWG